MSRKQTEAWDAIHKKGVDELMYGGAKGGAKSVFLCFWMYLECYELARKYVPDARANPIPVGWLGRKRAKDFKETTLETWKRFIPNAYYRLKGDPPDIIIGERVIIRTGGLSSQEEVEKFNSAEYARIGLDQAEETSRDDVAALRATRRLVLDNQPVPAKIVWTCNPRVGWLKDEFIDHPKPNKVFIPALYKDNPWLSDDYVNILNDAFGHRPDLLRAYRDGVWTGLGAADQVILEEWLIAAENRTSPPPYIKRLVSVDPARFGDDLCVILGLENFNIVDAVVLPKCPEPQIVAEAGAMSVRMGDVPIVVEVVGMCGVGDQLLAQGRNVIEYKPGSQSSNKEKYYNLRAEAHDTVARWFNLGVFDERRGLFVTFQPPKNADLLAVWRKAREQLMWATYSFRGEKCLISDKGDIKADHDGVSPDYADAYVNGVFCLQFVDEFQGSEQKPRGLTAIAIPA